MVGIFFGKGYVRKRAKMTTVLGVFKFDAILSCLFGWFL